MPLCHRLTLRSVEAPIQQLVINPFYTNDPRYGPESRRQPANIKRMLTLS